MPFSIPYVMVKNIAKEQKMLVDYSKNPCPNELSDFLKCVTDKRKTNKTATEGNRQTKGTTERTNE